MVKQIYREEKHVSGGEFYRTLELGRNHRFPSYINKLFVAAMAKIFVKNAIIICYKILTNNIIFWMPSRVKNFTMEIKRVNRDFFFFLPNTVKDLQNISLISNHIKKDYKWSFLSYLFRFEWSFWLDPIFRGL